MLTLALPDPKQSPDLPALQAEYGTVAKELEGYECASPEEYEYGAELGKTLNTFIRRVEDFFRDAKTQAHGLHKTICSMENTLVLPARQQLQEVDRKRLDWRREEERKQLEERRRQEAEARKRQEVEAAERAAALERQGQTAAAAAIVEDAIATPPLVPELPPPAPKVAGEVLRQTYKAEVVDKVAFVAFVAQHREYLGLVEPNQTALNALVRGLEGRSPIPGIVARPVDGFARRRA